MLRAVGLLSFLRRLHRFITTSHPAAMDACYLAACSLPGPDFHRLAVDSFQDTQREIGLLHEGGNSTLVLVLMPVNSICTSKSPSNLRGS